MTDAASLRALTLSEDVERFVTRRVAGAEPESARRPPGTLGADIRLGSLTERAISLAARPLEGSPGGASPGPLVGTAGSRRGGGPRRVGPDSRLKGRRSSCQRCGPGD